MNFIFENNYSICDELCKEIIEMYENEEEKHKGLTLQGVNINVKDTFDFNIPHSNDTNSKWSKIENFLYKELKNNLSKYIDQITWNCHECGPPPKRKKRYCSCCSSRTERTRWIHGCYHLSRQL
jgi:rubrerythrin